MRDLPRRGVEELICVAVSHMDPDSQRIIQAIHPQLGSGQVQHDSNGVWEWRGALYGVNARVRAEQLNCQVQVEAQNPLGEFSLRWGPKLFPDPSATDNDAFDVADEVRVWVGRCVVIECYGLELDSQIAGFRAFPAEGTGYLVEAMQRDHVRTLAVDRFGLTGFVDRNDNDVVAATVRFTQLLAWTGAQIQLVAPNAQQHIAAGKAQAAAPDARLRCGYCAALFLLSQTGRCPSCGAPAG